MFEVFYTTSRVATIDAGDRETAKRRFAAYVLYDDVAHVRSDLHVTAADAAEVTPALGAVPTKGTRDEMRAWLARSAAEAESFEVGLFEDPERRLDTYLRLLATNDPWRLEGHGSLGRVLSAVPISADLTTFDGRVRYRFDATQFLDYVGADAIATLDPARPHDSVRVANMIDVSALHDDGLRQIASSYEAIANEHRLTARFAADRAAPVAPFTVTFARESWLAYAAHRAAEPARFLPPPDWTSAFPSYGDERGG